ncbi:hypothetical protein WKK05_07505 [Nostoc sp. UHCC 0302]|uniref:hypothetical protein n=1 Tax=Nostoc sp. UHCC 0302 TaxID=3134896 RepID=UPI00311CC15D
MQRISVLNPDHSPAMPTKLQRAERWVEEGRAEWVYTDLRIKAVRLLSEPSGRESHFCTVCDCSSSTYFKKTASLDGSFYWECTP